MEKPFVRKTYTHANHRLINNRGWALTQETPTYMYSSLFTIQLMSESKIGLKICGRSMPLIWLAPTGPNLSGHFRSLLRKWPVVSCIVDVVFRGLTSGCRVVQILTVCNGHPPVSMQLIFCSLYVVYRGTYMYLWLPGCADPDGRPRGGLSGPRLQAAGGGGAAVPGKDRASEWENRAVRRILCPFLSTVA